MPFSSQRFADGSGHTTGSFAFLANFLPHSGTVGRQSDLIAVGSLGRHRQFIQRRSILVLERRADVVAPESQRGFEGERRRQRDTRDMDTMDTVEVHLNGVPAELWAAAKATAAMERLTLRALSSRLEALAP